MMSESNVSKFFKELYENITKLLIFYDVKTNKLREFLEIDVKKIQKQISGLLSENGLDINEIELKMLYNFSKFMTYDNLLKSENRILLLFLYSELENYLFKSFKYIILQYPEILKDKTVSIIIILNSNKNLDLIPLGNTVVIKSFIVEKTKSGIYLSKDSINLSEGRVLKAGPSAKRVKEGDLVLFGKNVGSKIDRNGETFTLCFDSHIECKIDESKFNNDNLVKGEE